MAIIGFDIGTFETRVSIWQQGNLRLLPIGTNSKRFATASRLIIDEDCCVIGDLAVELGLLGTQSVWSLNRFRLAEPSATVMDSQKRRWTSELQFAAFLKAITRDIETMLGQKIEVVVLAVPDSLSQAARLSLQRAVQLSDLRHASLLGEFHAIALFQRLPSGGKHLIVDWGHAGMKVALVSQSEKGPLVAQWTMLPQFAGVRIAEGLALHWNKVLKSGPSVDASLANHDQVTLGSELELLANLAIGQIVQGRESIYRTSIQRNQKLAALIASARAVQEFAKPLVQNGLDQLARWCEKAGIHASSLESLQLCGGVPKLLPVGQALRQHALLGQISSIVEIPDNAIAFGAALHAAQQVRHTPSMEKSPGATPASRYEFGMRSIDTVTGQLQFIPLVLAGTPLPAEAAIELPSFTSQQEKLVIDIVRRKGPTGLLEDTGRWEAEFHPGEAVLQGWQLQIRVEDEQNIYPKFLNSATNTERPLRYVAGLECNNRPSRRDVEFLESLNYFVRPPETPRTIRHSSSAGR